MLKKNKHISHPELYAFYLNERSQKKAQNGTAYAFLKGMSGYITKKHLLQVARAFGLKMAVRFLFSKEKTFLNFCIRQKLV